VKGDGGRREEFDTQGMDGGVMSLREWYSERERKRERYV
jgi:hypothetical protein